jgi:hypothetical protein
MQHSARLHIVMLAVALLAFSAPAQEAIDKNVGVWKMDAENSNWQGENPPTTVVLTTTKVGPNSVRDSFELTFKDGQKANRENVRTFDGKERPLDGSLTQACEIIDANTDRCTEKRDGKAFVELLATVSQDGKTRFVQRTQFAEDGRPRSAVVVYRKQ